jgi:hypothetical protein
MCIENRGHEASLLVGKVYRVLKPAAADSRFDLRVVDEEGEDYLYPLANFVQLELPIKARRALNRANAI